MSLKEIIADSADSEDIFYIRMYDVALRGFYKLHENKLKYSEYQQKLEKDNIEEAMFVGYVVMKGKAIKLRHKDQFEIDTENNKVKIYRAKYEPKGEKEKESTIKPVITPEE